MWFAAALVQPITFSAESSKVDARPQFPCINPKLAARYVQGAQQLLPGTRKALTKHLEAQELTN